VVTAAAPTRCSALFDLGTSAPHALQACTAGKDRPVCELSRHAQ
jgi:hypothetical protein